MLPGDRLVCAFAHPQQVGAEFTSWPLHVTIVPWFRNDVASEVLAADFSDHIAEKPFLVVMGEKAKLGHGRRGNWVQQPSPFTDIEPRIRKVLKSYESWLVDETTKQKRPYRPHITAALKIQLPVGTF